MFFFFIIYLWKKKSFYNFNPQTKSILAVYKYSRRLLTRALSPKLVSNNFSSWLSHDWLNHYQFFSEFNAPSWKCANESAPVKISSIFRNDFQEVENFLKVECPGET